MGLSVNERAIRFQFVERRHILMPGVIITQSLHHLDRRLCKWVAADTDKLAGFSERPEDWQTHKSERQRGGWGQSCDRFSLSPLLFRRLETGDEDEHTVREADAQRDR